MPSKTPNKNGNEPVGNGVNATQDVEMNDDTSAQKGGRGKNVAKGENMTVVVPPSKANKPSGDKADAEGDVEMDEATVGEEVVDPVTQTITCRLSELSVG